MHRGGFLKVFLVISAITLLMDWYVFNGLRTLTADWQNRPVRLILIWGFLLISVGVTVVFLVGLNSLSSAKGMTPFHEWMLSLFLTFFVTKLVFVIVLSVGDLGRFITGIVHAVTKDGKTGEPVFPSRRKFISEIAILLAAIPFIAFFYAMLRGKYDYKVHRQTIYYDELPEAFDGFTITQLSDIHSGSFDNVKALQRGIDLAKAQKSDLFVFTGDLVNNAAWEIEQYIDRFGAIKAPFGQFSILGNHDYGDYISWESEQAKHDNLAKLKQHHAELGYRLLLDENVVLEKGGQKIALVGVENWGEGFVQKGDLDRALKGTDFNAFKILLSHDPTHWEKKVRYHPVDVHLTLSGHTHGAQFGIEAAGLKWSPVKYRYLDWAGLINNKNRYLYVNRGFGFLAFSGRLGIWPEITVITLKKKRSA
ncbi:MULTISPECIES: metallophosphoesterase [unclassified Mucilaginibacter]|uniref:metallophosphoesterase n=1 Tax=unclassified Mucilaginibacter TaxID=2617802 RepID=UPI002AC9914E|nr:MULTISPECIES: metallophosphoesterase [unclassified Mucilaginibacter]MEB0261426.1 metallophosphoesterase [Mucilaginibacter sp. 10I4]MEB0276988.1 metallophosphoesterase [Mucilaginibacter sp. 10B2]MEB0301489.1 metallophosphoesterase [Mucilaginibacter sp. 5C4]WPX25088.1 metallophosphoesterase [Mucilaginibacter sp. 5C4]